MYFAAFYLADSSPYRNWTSKIGPSRNRHTSFFSFLKIENLKGLIWPLYARADIACASRLRRMANCNTVMSPQDKTPQNTFNTISLNIVNLD